MRYIILPALLFSIGICAQSTFHRVIRTPFGSAKAMARSTTGDIFLASQYVIAGGSGGVQVVRFNGEGNAQWGSVLNSGITGSNTFVNDVIATGDGGVAVAGYRADFSGNDSAFVAKLDGTGSFVWGRAFKNLIMEEVSCRALRVVEAPNGDLIVGGEVEDEQVLGNFHADLFLARFTSTGTLLWNKFIMPPVSGTFNRLGDILAPTTGGILICAQTSLLSEGSWLMQLTDAGTMNWTVRYDTNGSDPGLRPFRLMQEADGYVILYRPTYDASVQLCRIVTNDTGQLTSSRYYASDTDLGSTYDAIDRPTGGFAAVGYTRTEWPGDAFQLLVNADGTVGGARRYGTGGAEHFQAIERTSDDHFLMAGYGQEDSLSTVRGGISTQIYLVKAELDGQSHGCDQPATYSTSDPGFTSTTYTQQVADTNAWNASGGMVTADYDELAVCTEVGINGQTARAPLRLFPNPASSQVRIVLDGPGPWRHELLDTFGRIVLRGTGSDIDVSSLPAGTYHARISSASILRSMPLVVIR